MGWFKYSETRWQISLINLFFFAQRGFGGGELGEWRGAEEEWALLSSLFELIAAALVPPLNSGKSSCEELLQLGADLVDEDRVLEDTRQD
jgi:hypothetical protein